MNRAEHLQWCKDRAMKYVNSGDMSEAIASMTSDLNKHSETAGHAGILLGIALLAGGYMNTTDVVKEFINGFN